MASARRWVRSRPRRGRRRPPRRALVSPPEHDTGVIRVHRLWRTSARRWQRSSPGWWRACAWQPTLSRSSKRRRGAIRCRIRSPTCICTLSSRCSTARRGWAMSWPLPPPTASRRWASPTTATCTASSTSTRQPRNRASSPSSVPSLYQAYEHRTERPARRGRMDDSGGEAEGGRKAYYHLTALAESNVGYKNLIQLSSRAYLEGYYMKPKVDWELLEAHHEGIIASTGCLGGQVLQALMQGDIQGRPREGRPPPGHLRQGQPLRRAPGPGHPRAAHHQPAAAGDRSEDRGPRCSPPTTATTPTSTTPSPTTPCSACRRGRS